MQYKFLSERMFRTFEQTLHALPEVTQRAIVMPTRWNGR